MVEIKITGDTTMEVLTQLATMGQRSMRDSTVAQAAQQALAREDLAAGGTAPVAPAPAAPAPAAPVPAPAPMGVVPTAPATPAAPAPMPAAPTAPAAAPAPVAPVAPAPAYTMAQISKAGADLASQDPAKMPELLALLQGYGVRAITELQPDQLGAFASALRGLGAKL